MEDTTQTVKVDKRKGKDGSSAKTLKEKARPKKTELSNLKKSFVESDDDADILVTYKPKKKGKGKYKIPEGSDSEPSEEENEEVPQQNEEKSKDVYDFNKLSSDIADIKIFMDKFYSYKEEKKTKKAAKKAKKKQPKQEPEQKQQQAKSELKPSGPIVFPTNFSLKF